MNAFIGFCELIVPIVMIAIGYGWKKSPPKNIGWDYGYRTSMSMKNQQTWDFAQKKIAEIWMLMGVISLFISFALCLMEGILKFIRLDVFAIALPILQCIIMVVAIIPVEVSLRIHFDSDGNPKH